MNVEVHATVDSCRQTPNAINVDARTPSPRQQPPQRWCEGHFSFAFRLDEKLVGSGESPAPLGTPSMESGLPGASHASGRPRMRVTGFATYL